jgi:hypothetical protein
LTLALKVIGQLYAMVVFLLGKKPLAPFGKKGGQASEKV